MKVTLTQTDILTAVREYLERRGFQAPSVNGDDFGVFHDELTGVSIEVDDIQVLRAHAPALAPSPRTRRSEDFGPGELLPEKAASDAEIKAAVAKSKELEAKPRSNDAQGLYSKVQMGESIEDLGKDPTDFQDEL